MSSRVSELEKEIEELKSKIETLSARCDQLEERVVKLVFSKVTDPRYPFWDWLLMSQMPEDDRKRLTILLSALDSRVAGEQLPEEYNKDIDGVSRDLLYGSGIPPVDEVLAAIKSVTGMKYNRQVFEMLRAVKAQGMFRDLCEHVLETLDV